MSDAEDLSEDVHYSEALSFGTDWLSIWSKDPVIPEGHEVWSEMN